MTTPGKWEVACHAPFSVWCGETQIASCKWYFDDECTKYDSVCEKDDSKAEANAKLIACAPDLLEALQDVLATTAWNRIGNDALHKALAVIERVTGETYNPTETE